MLVLLNIICICIPILSAQRRWVKSQATRNGVDSDIAKYNGKWAVEELKGSNALVMKA